MFKLKLLRSKALFGGLDDSSLKKISSLLQENEFKEGTNIIEEGQRDDKMYIITEGEADVYKYNRLKKKQEKITELKEGDSFGEMELIDIQECCATVKAVKNTKTVSLDNKSLLLLSKGNLEIFSIIVVNIARIISRKLRATDAKLVSIMDQ